MPYPLRNKVQGWKSTVGAFVWITRLPPVLTHLPLVCIWVCLSNQNCALEAVASIKEVVVEDPNLMNAAEEADEVDLLQHILIP